MNEVAEPRNAVCRVFHLMRLRPESEAAASYYRAALFKVVERKAWPLTRLVLGRAKVPLPLLAASA
jgi:hypothetical protein